MCETIRKSIIPEVQKKACIFLIMLAMLVPTVTIYGHDDRRNIREAGKNRTFT